MIDNTAVDTNVKNNKTIKDNNENILKKENIYLLITSVVLGILFDVLFYGKPLGISYPIFVIGFYSVLLWNSRKGLSLKLDFAWFLSIPVLALSLAYFIFSNGVFQVLNFMAVPILVVIQTTLITGNEKNRWYSTRYIVDILYGFFYRPFAYFSKPFVIVSRMISTRTGLKKDSAVLKVLMGVLISIPLLLIIITLLASADQVFGHFVGEIPNLFKNISIGEFIVRFLLAALAAVLIFSYIWSLMNPKPSSYIAEGSSNSLKAGSKKLDSVITVTILSMVNVIYVFFTIIQFSYLFGSLNYGLPTEFTYAEYARRGFFELVVVTLINMSILLIFLNFTKKDGKLINKTVRIMYSLLVACTLVMLFSAHFRMSLYEEAYGYTYLRIFTHAFMVFLFILFILTLYRVWREEVKLLKLYIITSIAAFMIINYANVDTIIARNNIDRYYNTGKIDISYLTCLSYDAVPELTQLLEDEDDRVAGKIGNYLYEKKEELNESRPWQSFNISRYRAKRVLSKYELCFDEKYKDRVDEYRGGWD